MQSLERPAIQNLEAAQRFGFHRWDRYAARAETVFKGIDLADRRVCDVGCGPGMWSIWCGLQGATVVALEPEADGSAHSVYQKLCQAVADFHLEDRVRCERRFVEEYLATSPPNFDVMLLWNVINHLDEDAVQKLPGDLGAAAVFTDKFRMLRAALNPGGWLIVADAARSNLWGRLGIRCALAGEIEWHKHQNPEAWLALAEQAGFQKADLRWAYLKHRLRHLTGNRLAQYFTMSQFVLQLRAV